jgi:C2H2-type zinc finger
MIEHKNWCKQKCKICVKEFTGDIALLEHITSSHKDVNIEELEWLGDLRNLRKDIKCEQCNRQFYKLKALNAHVLMSHGTKELKRFLSCDLCKRQLSSRGYLQKHMKTVHRFIIKVKKS